MVQASKIFELLDDSESLVGREPDLKRFLSSQVARFHAREAESNIIAYEVAGLMSTRALAGVPDENPYMRVLLMAGELELPEPHRASGVTWEAFVKLVDGLP